MVIFRLLFILLLAGSCLSQETKDNQLTVYGKVKVFAKADRASLMFNLEGFGSNLKSAFDDARIKMGAISSKLSEIGLSDKNISTSFFQSSENYGGKAFLSSKKDYRVTMTVMLTTDSLELIEPAVIILSESKVENIGRISFDLINYSELRKRGLVEATAKAKEKADLVCKELGIKYEGIISVEEIEEYRPQQGRVSSYSYPEYGGPFNAPIVVQANRDLYDNGELPVFYSQEMSFYSEVKVVFKIEDDAVDSESAPIQTKE